MATLYYNPMTFASASYITAHVTGALDNKRVQAVFVDLEPGNPASKHVIPSTGEDYRKIAPRGAVPVLDVGSARLDENPAVLLFLAEQGPVGGLLTPPSPGSVERGLLATQLAFISSEIHSNILWLLRPIGQTAEVAGAVQDVVAAKLEHLYKTSGLSAAAGGAFLAGAHLSVADLYLNAIIGFLGVIGVGPKLAPATAAALRAYSAKVEAVPQVAAALKAIGSPTKPPQ